MPLSHCGVYYWLGFQRVAPRLSAATGPASPRLPLPLSAGRAVSIRRVHLKFYGLTHLWAEYGPVAKCGFLNQRIVAILEIILIKSK